VQLAKLSRQVGVRATEDLLADDLAAEPRRLRVEGPGERDRGGVVAHPEHADPLLSRVPDHEAGGGPRLRRVVEHARKTKGPTG